MNELLRFILMVIMGIPWGITGISIYASYCSRKNTMVPTMVVGIISLLVGDTFMYLYGLLCRWSEL